MASRDLSSGFSFNDEPRPQSDRAGLPAVLREERRSGETQVATTNGIASPYSQAFPYPSNANVDTSSITPVYFDSIDANITQGKNSSFKIVTYSDSFIKIKTTQFINEFSNGLVIWTKVLGKTSELKEVRSLFSLIESYSKYLDSRNENRVMLGSLQNFLSKWSTYNQKNLEHLITLLENFKDDEIELRKLKTFTSEVFVLINSNAKKEKEI